MVRRSAEIEHERAVAIFDLLRGEQLRARSPATTARSTLHLAIDENRLVVRHPRRRRRASSRRSSCRSPPFRSMVKDYFLICESYYDGDPRGASPSQIEAIDMGRRGLHNEGSELLRERLAGKIDDRSRHRAAAVHADLRAAHPGLMLRGLPSAASCSPARANAIRSPMAEALLKQFHGRRIYVDSVGVRRRGELDPLRGRGHGRDRHRPHAAPGRRPSTSSRTPPSTWSSRCRPRRSTARSS